MVTASQHPSLRLAERGLAVPLVVGLAVRVVLLLLAGDTEPINDEKSYIYRALVINRFGVYADAWPPGYPFVLALVIRLLGFEGLGWIKLCQVVCSLVVGYCVVQMSQMVFGTRGARLSGYAWALYLPLAFYTHRFWPETFFLCAFMPAMYLLAAYFLRGGGKRPELLLASAGLCLGLSLYFKEAPTFLVVPLGLWALLVDRRRLSRGMIFPLAVVVVVLPWTLRNYELYGRVVPLGNTLGANLVQGLNAPYVNQDYNRDPGLARRVHWHETRGWDLTARVFMLHGSGWPPSHAPNDIDRTRVNLRRSLQYTLGHPASFVLTRVKKLADFATPLSLLVRDLSPEVYSGPLVGRTVRPLMLCVALCSVVALLVLAWINLVRLWDHRPAAAFFTLVIVYFGLSVLLVSMSRYRIPMVPLLLVLVGGTVVSGPSRGPRRRTVILSACGVAVLLGLWALNLAEVSEVVARVWDA